MDKRCESCYWLKIDKSCGYDYDTTIFANCEDPEKYKSRIENLKIEKLRTYVKE